MGSQLEDKSARTAQSLTITLTLRAPSLAVTEPKPSLAITVQQKKPVCTDGVCAIIWKPTGPAA